MISCHFPIDFALSCFYEPLSILLTGLYNESSTLKHQCCRPIFPHLRGQAFTERKLQFLQFLPIFANVRPTKKMI